jgi:C4-dicarboxylate transporter DctM subunit
MTSEIVGLIGIIVIVVLLFCRMWIGMAMAFIGFLGYIYLEGTANALFVMGNVPYTGIAFYNMSALPLFVLMGTVISNTGVGAELYSTAYKWMGHFRGGLAIATITACGGFAAISGSSMAGAVTMGKVSLPEMKKYNYDDSLATSCVAAGGTLGILIPPSLGFIIYGIITQESIGKLFLAGIFPGILLMAMFIGAIVIVTAIRPTYAPMGPGTGFREKVASLKNTWAVLVLFLLVLGGIYLGVFTPTEAGAVGAFGSILITFISRKLTLSNFGNSLLQTGQTTAMIVLLIVGSMIFMRFLTVSSLPFSLAEFVSGLAVPRYAILAIIVLFYLLAGMFLEVFSCMVLTVPFIYPVIISLGFDAVWFGVVMVIILEAGLITPPVGMNVFALAGVTDVPLGTIFRGVWPFVGAMILCIVILTIFPSIALFIPGTM